MENSKKLFLEEKANSIRKKIIKLVYKANSPGGSLSVTDILTYLYFEEMNVDSQNPQNPNRDRFVLSKGHCAPALYSCLIEKGFFAESNMEDFRQVNGILQGHPDMKHIPGVDMTTRFFRTRIIS